MKRSAEALRDIATRGAVDLAHAPAREVIAWAAEEFSGAIVATQSMANLSLGTLIETVDPSIPVVFADTGLHFPETLRTRDEFARRSSLSVVSVTSTLSLDEQQEKFGDELWSRDADLCCTLRKVQPLEAILASSEAWLTGFRRSEAAFGIDVQIISFDERRAVVKIAPLLNWSDEDVAAFTEAHDVIVNPLMRDGFTSIGCWPCTRRVTADEDPRAGRWPGSDKTECGLHL